MDTEVYNSLRHLAHAKLGKLDKSNRSTCQNILTHKTMKSTGNLKVQYLGVLGVCYFVIPFLWAKISTNMFILFVYFYTSSMFVLVCVLIINIGNLLLWPCFCSAIVSVL